MKSVAEMSRDERRTAKNITTLRTQAVIDAYQASGNARAAVAILAQNYGVREAAQMVATVINRVGLWDGRIYDAVREWAQATGAPSNEELEALGCYGVDSWIHSAHVNEIGQAMRKYEPTGEEPKEPNYSEEAEALMNDSEPEEPKRTKAEVIADIIEAFKENDELFTACADELDCYDGFLGDDRVYSMDDLDEIYHDTEPSEILARAFYGYDADSWSFDSSGNKLHGAFNPNRDFFYFNGYGNLVSCDYIDYSDRLDSYAVEAMSENRRWIDSIEIDDALAALFDELEACEE